MALGYELVVWGLLAVFSTGLWSALRTMGWTTHWVGSALCFGLAFGAGIGVAKWLAHRGLLRSADAPPTTPVSEATDAPSTDPSTMNGAEGRATPVHVRLIVGITRFAMVLVLLQAIGCLVDGIGVVLPAIGAPALGLTSRPWVTTTLWALAMSVVLLFPKADRSSRR